MSNHVRVFVTHSSLDVLLAQALVDTLRLGTGLRPGQVFCSSIEGMDVEDGEDFIEAIRDQLNQATLVIPLITPAYLDSIFCMWELGAIWAMKLKMIAVRVDPVLPNDLPDLLKHKQVRPLGHPSLLSLSKAIAAQTGETVNEIAWQKQRTQLLDRLPEILQDLKATWANGSVAQLRLNARAGDATEPLAVAMEQIRDAGYVAMSGYGHDYNRSFKLALRESARSMAGLFRALSGHQVRITLKQLLRVGEEEGAAGLRVEDLVRDTANANHAGVDKVTDNTDFESIVVREKDFFFCNDLSGLRAQGQYKNSHVADGRPMPYESTIVWPIRKIHEDDEDYLGVEITDNDQDLVGFLCLDAKSPGAFGRNEVNIGRTLAAALYFPLRTYLFDDEDIAGANDTDSESEDEDGVEFAQVSPK